MIPSWKKSTEVGQFNSIAIVIIINSRGVSLETPIRPYVISQPVFFFRPLNSQSACGIDVIFFILFIFTHETFTTTFFFSSLYHMAYSWIPILISFRINNGDCHPLRVGWSRWCWISIWWIRVRTSYCCDEIRRLPHKRIQRRNVRIKSCIPPDWRI